MPKPQILKKMPSIIKGGYYIKARRIKDSAIAHAPPYVREIWDYLLREANYANKKCDGYAIKRGQLFQSYREIRDALSWKVGYRTESYNENQMKMGMRYLAKQSMITLTKQPQGNIITVCNYNYFQNPKNYETTNETTSKKIKKKNVLDSQQKENAQKLYYFYLEKIEPIRKTKIRTISNILRHAKKYSFKDLARAVVNYKTVMPQDIAYRKDPANFFGVNEPYFKDFLPENFGKADGREQAAPIALTDEKLRELNE